MGRGTRGRGETGRARSADARRPDRVEFTDSLLADLARRLVERGVRFVQIYHNNWDTHANVAGRLPDLTPPADGQNADFYFIDAADSEDAARKAVEVVQNRIPRRFGFGYRGACRRAAVQPTIGSCGSSSRPSAAR